jgi:hypothetical protein
MGDEMKKDWTNLINMTGAKAMVIERVSIEGEEIAIEGQFELPPLARIDIDDQVFVAVFIKCHGSIKEMERHFGVSYPTIKSRLNRIGSLLDFVTVESSEAGSDILDRLEQGEITVDEAIQLLKKEKSHE